VTAIELTRGIGSLLTFATTTVGFTFLNFVLRRADASLLGLPHRPMVDWHAFLYLLDHAEP
jgi:hypothetical protein